MPCANNPVRLTEQARRVPYGLQNYGTFPCVLMQLPPLNRMPVNCEENQWAEPKRDAGCLCLQEQFLIGLLARKIFMRP
jgi:hypothetical protein